MATSFNPDGRWFSVGDWIENYGTLRLWDLNALEPPRSFVVLPSHKAANSIETEINEIDFSPDNRWLVSYDNRGNIRLWTWQKK